MTEIDVLCEKCASGGVATVVEDLHDFDRIRELAKACEDRVRRSNLGGAALATERLRAALHYLHYLLNPYD